MKRYIIILALAGWLSSLGQNSCPDISNNTTDPDNPSDWRGNSPNTNPFINLESNMVDPRFDWRADVLEWFKPIGNPGYPLCTIQSPFLETAQEQNVDHLYHSLPELRDNLVSDGWELITFGFGKDKLGNVQSNFAHPRFVLYNKYTGIMRVFYYLREPDFGSDYDAVTIKMSFMEADGDKQSANLNHMTEVARPIDKYIKIQHEQVPNVLNSALNIQDPCSGMWLHADFTMAYDPCVCNYDYNRILIEVMATDRASITLTGDLTAAPISKTLGSSPPDGTTNFNDNYKTGFKAVETVGKEAKTYYEKTQGLTNYIAGVANKKVLDSRKQLFIGEGLKLAKGVPYLGAAVGVLNYFVFKEEASSGPSSQPVTFNATVNISGEIVNMAATSPITIEVPGSGYTQYPSASNTEHIPFYDEPLGVLSLLKTPSIEFSHIKAAGINANGDFEPIAFSDQLPTVTEYKIVDPLELVVNPSSELVLEEAKISVVISYSNVDQKAFHNGLDLTELINYPYIPGATILVDGTVFATGISPPVLLTNIEGYDNEDWKLCENSKTNLELFEMDQFYKTSYGQAPIGCFNETGFYLISQVQPTIETLPTVIIRVNATLKHPVTGVSYKFVHSYEVEKGMFTQVEREVQFYGVSAVELLELPTEEDNTIIFTHPMTLLPIIGTGPGANYYQSSKNKADFLVFEDETISGFVDAWEGIIIGNNVTIDPGTWLTAGRFIEGRPENTIQPEVKMQIGIRDGACLDDPNNFVTTDVGDFCDRFQPNSYNPIFSKRDESPNQQLGFAQDFNIFPNPTDELVNVEVELIDGANYLIDILDLSGRLVYSRIVSSQEFQNATHSINTSSFENGIYFVNVTEGDNRMTKRLIITR